MNRVTEKVNEIYGHDIIDSLAKAYVDVHYHDLKRRVRIALGDEALNDNASTMYERDGNTNGAVEEAVDWCVDDINMPEVIEAFAYEQKWSLGESIRTYIEEQLQIGGDGELKTMFLRTVIEEVDWGDLAELYIPDAGVEDAIRDILRELVEEKMEELDDLEYAELSREEDEE